MLKRILLVVTILLIGSLIGDIFFVHHHLDGATLLAEHAPSELLAAALSCLFLHPVGVFLASRSRRAGHGRDSSVRYFCGWHNSAYLEAALN